MGLGSGFGVKIGFWGLMVGSGVGGSAVGRLGVEMCVIFKSPLFRLLSFLLLKYCSCRLLG